MAKLVTVCALVLGSLTTTSNAAVWYVNKASSPTVVEDGAGWATAYKSLQPAIDAAANAGGGELWVAKGVYNEARSHYDDFYQGNSGILQMRTAVHLYGGFAGTEAQLSQRNWDENITTIDGSVARDGTNAYTVVHGAIGATFDGFVVCGGKGSYEPAGMTAPENSVIRNCTFSDNSGGSYGGALQTWSNVVVENCIFVRNRARTGGGGAIKLAAWHTDTMISRCAFADNTASEAGGAILAEVAVTLDRCTFRNNRVTDQTNGCGGAVCTTERAKITNCTFDGNSATKFGGAIFTGGTYDVMFGAYWNVFQISNCTFVNNTAGELGGALYSSLSILYLHDSILWDCIPDNLHAENCSPDSSVTYNIIQGGFAGAVNLDRDPLFFDSLNHNLQLAPNSPAVDAGILFDDLTPTIDLLGVARPQGAAVDMGAYEYRFPAESDINSDNAIDAVDIQLEINALLGLTLQRKSDVNGDGQLDAVDVQLVINAALS